MRNLIALVYFLFALLGCDTGGATLVTRTRVDGQDRLHARTRVQAGIGRFECIASDSGHCHYALFASDCARDRPDCRAQAFERFSMAVGASREIVGLPASFGLCVDRQAPADAPGPDCASLRSETVAAAAASAAR